MATGTGNQAIDTLFLEERRYPPPDFRGAANAQPEDLLVVVENGAEKLTRFQYDLAT